MWLAKRERVTLAWLGLAVLSGVGLLSWQRRKPPLVLERRVGSGQAASWDAALRQARRIGINSAGAEALERLPGVGPALAGRIVEYRAAHGPFGAAQELLRIEGIGPRTFGLLEDYVRVE